MFFIINGCLTMYWNIFIYSYIGVESVYELHQ